LSDVRELHFDEADESTSIELAGDTLHEVASLLDRVGYVSASGRVRDVEETLERWAMDEFLTRRLLPGRLLGELRRRAGAAWAYASPASRVPA
jgi:hypothetical protein